MVKKKIDNRLRVLIENGIRTFHRSLIVVVGDKGRDQVISYFIFLFNQSISSRL
jgi:N-acetyltransferase 10